MNNDLISRKYAVRELLEEREHYPPMVAERYSFGVKLPNRFNQAIRGGIKKGLRIVETAPAVDAVEVVRCKDCVYRGNEIYCPLCRMETTYDIDDGTDYYFIDDTVDDGYCWCGAKELSNHEYEEPDTES